MKVKKDKKLEKAVRDEESTEQTKKVKKSKKKQNMEKKEAENEADDETAISQNTVTKEDKPVKSVDDNIFQYFKELTSEEEKTRMEAALHLMQQVQRTKEAVKREKELLYCLKRLIRGCGASTNVSRAGFFTALVGFLKSFDKMELPLSLVFETVNKELHVGSTIANKEDADAIVGKILVCGAILHSGRLNDVQAEDLQQITNILLLSVKHRTYHSSLGFGFLCEIIEKLSQEQFESNVWPLLQKELIKPWPKQTLQSIYCLITVQKKFPEVVNAKFLKTNFGGKQLLNPESFQYLYKIFWQHSNTDILTHPAFECFGSFIASSKYLTQFWSEVVDPGLKTPTKLLEVETLKILTDILDNFNVEKICVHDLLSDNFMLMFIEGLKNLKQKNDDTLKAFYADFLESLVKCCAKLNNDANTVAVIKRLILPPGISNIEKFTGHRIIHQLINNLGEEGVKELFDLYKSIFLAQLQKNKENSAENWLNFERLKAGYALQNLLQHKSVHAAYQWREEQLKFLFSSGIFYVTDSAEICKKKAAGEFSKDFAEQCKNMFFICLQSKFNDIEKEQQLLFNLAEFCQEKMLKKHAVKYFRIKKFDDAVQKSWNKMFEHVKQTMPGKSDEKLNKKKKSGNKLQTVFNILLINMGLQLFREPEMAGPAIEDLLKCLAKTKEQKKLKKKSNKSEDLATEQEEEPEWIEVIVDLFLHLLSQNNNALRTIVNALFPHLCDKLSLTAIHQILAMLDMKDGNNPLTTKAEDAEEDEGEEEQDEDVDMETSAVNDKDKDSDEESNEEDGSDDEEEESDEDDENEGEEGVTASDKLRNAISQALIANGCAAGVDDDMESVDLNEMTEEEGRKLDEALANAFKALKKTSDTSSQAKKTKSYRIQTTTLMHFRIRVLDLIEIYLQQKPSLLISIEIMLALFNMLEYCVGDELKPLQAKVEKVLCKLTAQKNYTGELELKEESFADFLRLIVEKKAPANVYDIINRMRNKCSCFLIMNDYKIRPHINTEKVFKLCHEYLQEFIKSRNPIINITLISDIFKLRWPKNWQLAKGLAQKGLNLQTRTFRRIQIYELLIQLYKNRELQKLEENSYFKKIENSLGQHVKNLSENTATKHSLKEFQTLLDLLLTVHKMHQLQQTKTVLTSEEILTYVQNLRKLIRLDSPQIYQRFCQTFKLQVIRNTDLACQQNGEESNEDEAKSEDDKATGTKPNKTETKAQKRKLAAKDLRKIKKLKKQQRFESVSRGLNGGIGFTQRNRTTSNPAPSDDDNECNEDSD